MIEWLIFGAIVIAACALDLGVLNKKDHAFTFKQSLQWSIFWVVLSCLFGVYVYFDRGANATNQFFTAYVLEKSLSVDNLFVIYLIFKLFETPDKLQHRCLFWGIIGAIVMRFIFISCGVAIVTKFEFILYIFAAILVYQGGKILFSKEDEEESVTENKVVKYFKKHFNVDDKYTDNKFFIKRNGRRFATLLFVTLLMIETSDILFAVDSIPAALGVSNSLFVLFTSNIFAVLGLRAMYFMLSNIIEKFWALKYGVALVLVFIGAKMGMKDVYEISTSISLAATLGLLSLGIIISLMFQRKEAVA